MKFEEEMQKLAAITAKLEAGGLPLEEAVALYGEGAQLAAACKKELEQAKLTVSEYGQKPADASAENECENGS